MSKKNKKRKRKFIPDSEAKSELKNSFEKVNWRLVGRVFSLFVLVFSVYQLCLKLAEIYNNILIQQITLGVYTAILTILAAAFILVNGGISSDIPTKEQLKDSLTNKEKEEIIENITQRRKKAKKILVFLIPFIFTLFFDTLYLLLFVK